MHAQEESCAPDGQAVGRESKQSIAQVQIARRRGRKQHFPIFARISFSGLRLGLPARSLFQQSHKDGEDEAGKSEQIKWHAPTVVVLSDLTSEEKSQAS